MPKPLRPAPAPLPGWTREGLIWKSTRPRPADEPLRPPKPLKPTERPTLGTCRVCHHAAYSDTATYCLGCIHGTRAGEDWHARMGVPPCQQCREHRNARVRQVRRDRPRQRLSDRPADEALVRRDKVQLTRSNSTQRDREAVVAKFHAERLSDQQIANKTGLNPRTVLRIRQRLGLPANYDYARNRKKTA